MGDGLPCEAAGCSGAAVLRCPDCSVAFCGDHRGFVFMRENLGPLVAGPGGMTRASSRCEACATAFQEQQRADAVRAEAEEFARREAGHGTPTTQAEIQAATAGSA